MGGEDVGLAVCRVARRSSRGRGRTPRPASNSFWVRPGRGLPRHHPGSIRSTGAMNRPIGSRPGAESGRWRRRRPPFVAARNLVRATTSDPGASSPALCNAGIASATSPAKVSRPGRRRTCRERWWKSVWIGPGPNDRRPDAQRLRLVDQGFRGRARRPPGRVVDAMDWGRDRPAHRGTTADGGSTLVGRGRAE
jgi:hypothetical protein